MTDDRRIVTDDQGPTTDDTGLDELKRKIHRESGFNTHFYKDKCLRRRLAVRMRARGLESFERYAELLDQDPAEYEMLLDALTINVSKFFRNAEIWKVIEELVVPELFSGSPEPRRIWSAGCAAGEEPHSLAILLREWAEREGREAELERFEILGTDIDRRSLAAAQRAEYPELAMTETPEAWRERWFSPGPVFRLDPRVARGVEFRHHDLISDEPPAGLSLIVCRNVIIYFEREIQEELFRRFYEALLPGGILVLGKVETLLGRPRSLFRSMSHRDRIFRRPA